MTDILILTHVDFCPPGHLGVVLDRLQLLFDVRRADLGELQGCDLERPRAVAIMGGPMSVNDDLPWLRDEIAAIRRFIERDVPMIGHCLGGQLLAKALGADIHRLPYTELGWQPMRRQEGQSPWLAHLPDEFPIYQWHGDTFDIPEGGTRLLSSPWCENQGFSYGDRILGLQGHPEMTEELVSDWVNGFPEYLDSSQPSQESAEVMLDGLPQRVAAMNQVAEGFYRHWLKLAGLI
ncbi:GMP synthase [Pseudomonas sp. AU11447]|uniref:type 1 glutamine amidotransferase n=1 Tax=unclassified Pseudomonas TaxID=196821 RepID=UPI0006D3C536|nr:MULTISPECIES: type 1 glutamine amidotransferase [unclassified Pseudomonas]OBY90382.1 GMP synthase [Pseudomonas sp. AU11447]